MPPLLVGTASLFTDPGKQATCTVSSLNLNLEQSFVTVTRRQERRAHSSCHLEVLSSSPPTIILQTVAIDPEYSTKKDRQFVAGRPCWDARPSHKGLAGPKRYGPPLGRGAPIHAVRWRTSLVAWANDLGVKLYDMATGAED